MSYSAHHSPNLWILAWHRLRANSVAMTSLAVLGLFFVTLCLSTTGLIASDWSDEVAVHYAPPTFVGAQSAVERGLPSPVQKQAAQTPPENPLDPLKEIIRSLRAENPAAPIALNYYGISDPLSEELKMIRQEGGTAFQTNVSKKKDTLLFGADKWGHDILKKTIKGAETSLTVGIVAAFFATFLGTLLGALAGYFGSWVDDVLNWFYSVFTSIPYLLLILAIAAVLQQKGIMAIVLILGLTGWTGIFRLVRAEYMKHKDREYVMAANAIGASHFRKMFIHIFPNISHVALVQMSILVVGFIKAEVVLSFLGFGVPVGIVSWGSMLNEAQNELILGIWWQLVAATIGMIALVTAFSLFTDALRDALDPKLK